MTFSEEKMIHVKPKEYDDFINANELVLVDFSSEWCGGCIVQKEIFDKEGQVLQDTIPELKIVHMDTDNDGGISNQLKIEYIPTMVLYYKGIYAKMDSRPQKIPDIITFIQTNKQKLDDKLKENPNLIEELQQKAKKKNKKK